MILTFHNDKKLKAKYVKQVLCHQKADEIIKGKYWENGKGCAVGCIVEQCENPHDKMLELIGTPLWFNYLIDRLFEGQTNGKSKQFPLRLIKAIPVGKNIDVIYHKFYAWLLEDSKQYVTPKFQEIVYPSINGIIDLHLQVVSGKIPNIFAAESAAWSAARSAAGSAAESAAESAAWSVARSAARSAAWSAARSAAGSAAGSAARSAAWSAARSAARSAVWSAAESAAESAAYEKMADKLIELLTDGVEGKQ